MASNYNYFYAQMQSIVDSINHDADPAQRLSNLQRLTTDIRRMLIDSRDDAAYSLRSKYSSEDAAQVVDISSQYVDYWANRWRKKNGLDSLKRKKRIDLSNVIDLSGE